jgi:pimeloyl-ACP methyl ester carboxylesterase
MNGKLFGATFAVAIAWLAWCAPAFAQMEGRQETVRAGAATIHVTVRGTGEPIVLIPSYGRGAEDFDGLSKRLVAAGYQALMPDPRGMGGSTGPMDTLTLHGEGDDIAAVIKTLVQGRAILLGHAHGNAVARMVASDHPEMVKQVILLAAGGMVPRAPDIEIAFRKVFDKSISRSERLAAIQKSFFYKDNDASVWQDGWYFDVAAQQMAGTARVKLEEYWPGGKAPILVVQAKEDVIAVPENSKRLHDEFPDRVTVVEITGSGHAMLPEQPEKITAAIVAYMKR